MKPRWPNPQQQRKSNPHNLTHFLTQVSHGWDGSDPQHIHITHSNGFRSPIIHLKRHVSVKPFLNRFKRFGGLTFLWSRVFCGIQLRHNFNLKRIELGPSLLTYELSLCSASTSWLGSSQVRLNGLTHLGWGSCKSGQLTCITCGL